MKKYKQLRWSYNWTVIARLLCSSMKMTMLLHYLNCFVLSTMLILELLASLLIISEAFNPHLLPRDKIECSKEVLSKKAKQISDHLKMIILY